MISDGHGPTFETSAPAWRDRHAVVSVATRRWEGPCCGCARLHALGPRGLPRTSPTSSQLAHAPVYAGLAPEVPEDLYCLIKKAVSVRKHLDKFRADTDAKFRLILIESRIHRLARYYKSVKGLPPNWKYESSTASTLVS